MKREDKVLERYCEQLSSSPPAWLDWLERETHLKTMAPQMIAGKLQGRLLSTISRMLRPKTILEIGTFTGYSALCLAEGIREDGRLITVEANDELAWLIEEAISRSPYQEQIELLIGKAEAVLPGLDLEPDLVYIDAGKQDYGTHYERCLELMKTGAWMLVDNTLWSGKVVEGVEDADTEAIRGFNRRVLEDERTQNIILPIRDGISCIQKIA